MQYIVGDKRMDEGRKIRKTKQNKTMLLDQENKIKRRMAYGVGEC